MQAIAATLAGSARLARTSGPEWTSPVSSRLGVFPQRCEKNTSLVQSISQGPGEQDARAHK